MTANLTAIANLGNTTHFVELYATVEGLKVKLIAKGLTYTPNMGFTLETDLGEKVVESEEAEDAASDLEGAAKVWLEEMKVERFWSYRERSFSQAAFHFVYI